MTVLDGTGPVAVWRPTSDGVIRALVTCSTCHSGAVLDLKVKDFDEVRRRGGDTVSQLNLVGTVHQKGGSRQQVANHPGEPLDNIFEVVGRYPPTTDTVPPDLPDPLAREYREELLNSRASNRHTVGACRVILEMACKDRMPDVGGNLFDRIDALHTNGMITRSIADWAHTIRKLGNEALHGDPAPSREEADEVFNFTVLLLELLYSYPARIDRLKSRDEGEAQ